ncbi:MAG: protein kinase [bacterium]|nr:protein kinase [bacterium]
MATVSDDEIHVRTAMRILAFLIAVPLFLAGGTGLVFHSNGPEWATKLKREWPEELSQTAIERGMKSTEIDAFKGNAVRFVEIAESLAPRPIHAAVLAFGILSLGLAVWPRKRGTGRSADRKGAKDDAESAALETIEDAIETLPKKDRKKLLKAAQALEAEAGPEAAAEFLLDQNLKDDATEVFIRGELLSRAAEVRHGQNRFEEAADLYGQAERHEAAGAIYAQLERFKEAAECYLSADKRSVAGEMFERAECFREAGQCYSEIGFHRHAAQAFLKSGCEPEAADELVAAFTEEGGGALQQNDAKTKDLRGIARKAGELLFKLERFEEAESILFRAGAYGHAAKVAFQRGEYERSAELFLRVGRGDLAAKALERSGDSTGAARCLGEYMRDKGNDAEAAEHLVNAGEHGAAGDLFRKVERFEESGEQYWLAEDYSAAAEVFRAAGCATRAAEAFEAGGQFDQAADCFSESGDHERRAELLEKAEKLFEAGKVWADQGKPDEAIRLLQQVEPDDGNYSEACSLLGRVFEEKGMHSLSVKKFEEAAGETAITRTTVEANYELGRAKARKGDFSGAIEIFEGILSFDYHYRDASALLAEWKENAENQRQNPSTGPQTNGTGIPQMAPTENRYEIERELGRGGMGVVYLARDSVLEREIAFKVLPEGLRGNPNALRNFLREAKAAAQLNHPNIVTVYDAGDSERGFYIAMEYVQGTTLKEILRHRGEVAPGGVIYILRQMASALSYAHTKRVVHRDIKTANTMWAADKQVKIMDFGLAKLIEEVRNTTTLISGTPFYMSPEQTLGQNVDHRTDIYSLGVTLFELATGQLPFQKGNVPYHHVHTAPPDPVSVKPDLPRSLADLILKCLEKDPAARYQSAGELVEEVDRLTGK